MSKFLYYQDGHISGRNSVNRTGCYLTDWLTKFDELITIALENKVEAILDGGDLFHSPIVSYNVCDAIVDRIEKSGLTYYCLFGNHSERYHSKEHSHDTTLAHILRRSRNFRHLNVIEGKDFAIVGIEYCHNVEEQLKEIGLELPYEKNIWRLAIVHAFITPEPFPFASHVVCDDINTNVDIVFVAHYHKCWQKVVGNTEYVDIGCFGRNSITEADIIPKCILLDTEKRNYEIIPLNSAKPGHEVFDLKKIEELKANDASIEEFIKSIESTKFQGQRIEDIIKQIAKEQNIEPKVVEGILEKINGLQT